MPINIAIDGPAGAGKSSIAKEVAKKFGYIYVDTGALYRTIGLFATKKIGGTKFPEKIIEILPQIDIKIRFVEGEQHVILNGEDVSEEIRLPEISMAASNVSSIPEVREFLLEFQHKLARENNVLMDGRDIGTVILPNADVKIFLTASAEERANRRFKQLSEKPDCPTYEDILNDIIKRDYNDSHRAAAPLKQADDAVLIDSSSMNILETIEKISEVINQKLGGAK